MAITQIETLDSARVLDQGLNEWEKGWQTVFKRVKDVSFFTAKSVGVVKQYSESFFCAPYSRFELLCMIGASGIGDNLTIEVETSDTGGTWYKKTDIPYGSLKWQGTLGDKNESIQGVCTAGYIRLTAVSTVGTWVVGAKLVFVT